MPGQVQQETHVKAYKVTIKGEGVCHSSISTVDDPMTAMVAALYPFITGQLPMLPDSIDMTCSLAVEGEVMNPANN